MSYNQAVKDIAYRLDPECWTSYSGKPQSKQYIEARRAAALQEAHRYALREGIIPDDRTCDVGSRCICGDAASREDCAHFRSPQPADADSYFETQMMEYAATQTAALTRIMLTLEKLTCKIEATLDSIDANTRELLIIEQAKWTTQR